MTWKVHVRIHHLIRSSIYICVHYCQIQVNQRHQCLLRAQDMSPDTTIFHSLYVFCAFHTTVFHVCCKFDYLFQPDCCSHCHCAYPERFWLHLLSIHLLTSCRLQSNTPEPFFFRMNNVFPLVSPCTLFDPVPDQLGGPTVDLH